MQRGFAVALALALGGCAFEQHPDWIDPTIGASATGSGSETSSASASASGSTGSGDGTTTGDGDSSSTSGGDGDGTTAGDGDGTTTGDGDAGCRNDPRLIACFRFETLMSNATPDGSMYGHDLTVTAGGLVVGVNGNALRLTADSQAFTDITMAADEFTMALWVRPTVSPAMNERGLMGRSDAFDLFINNPTGTVQCNVPGVGAVMGGSVPAMQWTHVACTYDGTTLALYINGAPETAFDYGIPLPPTTAPLRVGRYGAVSLPAGFDDVQLWSSALAAGDICGLTGQPSC